MKSKSSSSRASSPSAKGSAKFNFSKKVGLTVCARIELTSSCVDDILGAGGADSLWFCCLLLTAQLLGFLLKLDLLLSIRFESSGAFANVDIPHCGADILEEMIYKVLLEAWLGGKGLKELVEDAVGESLPVFFRLRIGGFEARYRLV